MKWKKKRKNIQHWNDGVQVLQMQLQMNGWKNSFERKKTPVCEDMC